jgi:hypothetical protein
VFVEPAKMVLLLTIPHDRVREQLNRVLNREWSEQGPGKEY